MTGVDGEILKYLAAIGLLLVGAGLKHLFDRLAVERGWLREDRKAQDGKIERVDSHARAEVTRIERELGGRLGSIERDVGILKETVEHLPTAQDIARLAEGLARVDRGLGGVQAKVDGMNGNIQTVLQHILAGERRA